jgi:hypothetical protein
VKGSQIFLGDLIEVVHRLGACGDNIAIARVGAALGFAAAPSIPRIEPLSPPSTPPVITPTSEKPEPANLRKPTKTPTPLMPTRKEPIAGAPPAWLDQVISFPVESDADIDFTAPYEPLFATPQARSIVSAALAARLPAGEIDEERLVALCARREPITAVPHRPIASLRNGVQILLDRRDAMMPFFGDQNHLVDIIRTVVGRDRLSVVQFLHHPTQVLSPDRRRGVSYRPPVAGTTILIITDLGIGVPPLAPDRVSENDWRRLADIAMRAGCPLVALVPYSPDRWPGALARAMIILQWDRPTTAGVVRRRVGPGLVKP